MANADGSAPRAISVDPIYVDRAIGQAKAAGRYARELVPAEVKDPTLRQKVAEAGATAAGAFEDFAAFLATNRARASGDYAIGEELYTALLREKELLPFGTRELRDRGREQVVVGRGPQRLAQIGGILVAEAGVQRAGAGDQYPVTGLAEIMRHRRDEAEPAAGLLDAYVTRRSDDETSNLGLRRSYRFDRAAQD